MLSGIEIFIFFVSDHLKPEQGYYRAVRNYTISRARFGYNWMSRVFPPTDFNLTVAWYGRELISD